MGSFVAGIREAGKSTRAWLCGTAPSTMLLRMVSCDLVDRRKDEVGEATGLGTGRLTRRAIIVLRDFPPAYGGGFDQAHCQCDGSSV